MAGTAYKVLAIVFGIIEGIVAFFFILTLLIQQGMLESSGIAALVFLPFFVFSIVFMWIFTILLIVFGVLFVVFLVLAITKR
ncbi:MAG: hypothetical protein ACFFCS_17550 [Candidatus Hodarchaeota archaeon]